MSDLHLIHGFHAVTSRLRQREGAVKEIYFDSARHDRRGKDLLALDLHDAWGVRDHLRGDCIGSTNSTERANLGHRISSDGT